MRKKDTVPHVVIVGAGFGGVYTARYLKRYTARGLIRVTLVNEKNFFLFTPLLHEVATGGLSPQSVAEPLREVFSNTKVRILEGSVQEINRAGRHVTVAGYGTIPYDYLVIATGGVVPDYGIPGVAAHARVLKTLDDAISIRRGIIGAFEEAIRSGEKSIPITVVGGGPTGVELAAEIAEFTSRIEYRYFACGNVVDATVTLIESSNGLLSDFDPYVQRTARKILRKKGVMIVHGTVTEVKDGSLVLDDGRSVPSLETVWVAGIQPSAPGTDGALSVDEFLSAGDRVYALGDVAHIVDVSGQVVPKLAQAATKAAQTVAKNIIATATRTSPVPFRYQHSGTLISLGQWYAVGDIYGVKIRGKMVWWIWRTIYLFQFLSHKKRIRIAFEWTVNLFFPRDITNY